MIFDVVVQKKIERGLAWSVPGRHSGQNVSLSVG